MKEKEEGKALSPRRVLNAEHHGIDDAPSPEATQSVDTLRNGYSWIHTLEMRYPGWHPCPVEGFPFALPLKQLPESRVCLVSFAGVYCRGQRPFNTSPGVVPPQLRAMRFRDRGDWSFREIPVDVNSVEFSVSHAHYDCSEALEDINCVFPLMRLVELEVEGFIGECANAHYSLMGYVPEVELVVSTATHEIIPRLKGQEVDAVIVSGGCELSHQSGALVQREIEKAGIPTVGVTVCPDITYRLQVPRAVALRFPMGSPFGASMDTAMQSRILKDTLSLLHSVETPGEIAYLPYDWMKL